MRLELTASDAEILRTVLNRFVEETRSEIHHTDRVSYKEMLRGQEEAARRLLEKLATEPVSA